MKSFRIIASLVFVALAALGAVNSADGALRLEYRIVETGGAWTVLESTGNSVSGPGSDNVDGSGVNLGAILARSNSPGASPSSWLIDAAFYIENTSSSLRTIEIRAGETDYMFPDISQSGGRVGLTSSIGGTMWNNSGQTLTVSHQMWVDDDNLQSPLPSEAEASITAASGKVVVGTWMGTGFSASTMDESQYLNSLPFSLTTLTTLKIAGNSSANFTTSSTVYAVPEPASALAWGASGMFLLGMVALRRFKRSTASSKPNC